MAADEHPADWVASHLQESNRRLFNFLIAGNGAGAAATLALISAHIGACKTANAQTGACAAPIPTTLFWVLVIFLFGLFFSWIEQNLEVRKFSSLRDAYSEGKLFAPNPKATLFNNLRKVTGIVSGNTLLFGIGFGLYQLWQFTG